MSYEPIEADPPAYPPLVTELRLFDIIERKEGAKDVGERQYMITKEATDGAVV